MTHFSHHGEDQRRFIRHMFDEVAPRYDLLNRLLTLGMDVRWRRCLAAVFEVQPGDCVLDLACGTGDVARHIGQLHPRCRVVGADPVPRMLSQAKEKYPPLVAVCCEGESLPFRDNSFQAAAIAFGLRNFSCLEKGLQQVYRILVPGGRLGVLEFALPDRGRLRGFYRWYLYRVLPRLGALLSRGYAYRYLPESIERFPAPAELISLLDSTGFTGVVDSERFLGGTVRIYCGRKSQDRTRNGAKGTVSRPLPAVPPTGLSTLSGRSPPPARSGSAGR